MNVLRNHIPDESVDLIYLDPPFNSNATYNVLFRETSGDESAAQITAFEDTWHWGLEAEAAFREVVTEGPKPLADLLQAMRSFLGQNDMMAYLTMMAVRLVELHRVLKPTGSLYLHCDPTASHYIKLLLDSVFGPRNFRNEIVWHYGARLMHNKYKFNSKHDILFFYGRSNKAVINPISEPWTKEEYIRVRRQAVHVDEEGREYIWEHAGRGKPKAYKRYLDDVLKQGKPYDDVWRIKALTSSDKERLGYPTQKPEALLERIISASSNEGDLVLDPFCGCGTTVAVAERLGRRWIGIDITYLAVNLMRRRLEDSFREDLSPYRVIGIPEDVPSAAALAEENRHQFEWWAVDLAGGRPAQDKKKGADSGIDGFINFFDDESGKAKRIVIQVKSGNVTVSQVRDLVGVMGREKAVIGAFITLREPTKPMVQEAAAAGFYEPELYPGQRYPRVQILTIAELFDGRELQYPKGASATFKKAQRRRKGQDPEQGRIF